MARTIWNQNIFSGGIQSYPKTEVIPNGYYFGYCINYRDDPQGITLQPSSVKESGTQVTDLIKWGDILPSTLDSYFYGNLGNIYHRDSTGTWTYLHQASLSHGNGLAYFFADDYLYYTSDSWIGRYGPVTGSSPQFSDNFLLSQGGTPQNTNSLSLVAASLQYAHAANSASLDITGDLTLEAYFYANSLPTVGNSMTLIGKWDESGATRSYRMDIAAISGYFGDGSDGALTISSNTTEAPIDSACTGTAGTQTLSATNASFTQGQIILIHQTQGTSAGQWERNTIQGYTAGTITLGTPLIGTYTSGAQVRVLKQYSAVTVNSGITYTTKAWNGTVGGIIGWLCSGTTTIAGNVVADGLSAGFSLITGSGYTAASNGGGFRGGSFFSGGAPGYGTQGESQVGVGTTSSNANGNGGGAGYRASDPTQGGAGGGSLGTKGGNGTNGDGTTSYAGNTAGSTDLTSLLFGGGGGGGSKVHDVYAGPGGNGGGIVFVTTTTLTVSGSITSNGGNGSNNGASGAGMSGAGSGGSILLKAQTATLGSGIITANGGTTQYPSGNGGAGRIHLDYLTSYTGTTTPTLDATQDNSLVTTTTYQARLDISDNGTSTELATMSLNGLTTGVWNRLSISWASSTSLSTFYLNAVSLGTFKGTKTSINSNLSLLYVGADKGASAIENYFDGLLDDVRVWSNVQTASQILINNQMQLTGSESGLQAYYKLNGALTDSTANANDLTGVNSPTYSTNVPFPDPTTRLDIDTTGGGSTSTYTLLTTITETAANTLDFTPVNDPQKSIQFTVDTKGTGNWTVTIHDQQNVVIATQTITNANIPSAGTIEFVFSTPWRIVIGKTYHAHLTVSTGTSKIKATTNLSDALYTTFFGFLVTDVDFHPIYPFLNFVAIGNERYVATWDGAFYFPNKIAFPTGWRVRALSTWREFLAIGVWRGTTITSYTHGRVYFWDGISPTFNFFIDVPDGQINALWGRDSDLFIVAGYRGDLLDYQGTYFFDSGNSSSIKIRFLPKRSSSGSVEVFPGAINYYRNLLQVGFAGSSTMTEIYKGVYSYGTYDPQMPNTVSLDYLISTGNTGSSVSIGCVFPIGNKLIVGWQDGIAYGADVIDYENNNPAPHGRIEGMIKDSGAVWHIQTSFQVRADFLALKTGENVTVEASLDRGAFQTGSVLGSTDTSTSTGLNNFSKLEVVTGRARELQYAVNLYSTGSTSPTLLEMSALEDDLKEEEQY